MDYIDGRPLDAHTVLENLANKKVNAMSLWFQIFLAIEALRTEKIVHGDISLQNVLYVEETKELKLIDYGCASKLGNPRLGFSGSPIYISPSKLDSFNVEIMEDVYAWVMMILLTHASAPFEDPHLSLTHHSMKNSENQIFYDLSDKEKKPKLIPLRDYTQVRPEKLQDIIVLNAKRILKDAGYGEYSEKSASFTRLFVDIIKYKSPLSDFDEVARRLRELMAAQSPSTQGSENLNQLIKKSLQTVDDRKFVPFEEEEFDGKKLDDDDLNHLLRGHNIFEEETSNELI